MDKHGFYYSLKVEFPFIYVLGRIKSDNDGLNTVTEISGLSGITGM